MGAVAGCNTGWRCWYWNGAPAGIWRAETAYANGICGLNPVIVRGFRHGGSIVIGCAGGGADFRRRRGIIDRMPPDTVTRGKTVCMPSDSDFIGKSSVTGGYPGRRWRRHQRVVVDGANYRVVGKGAACAEEHIEVPVQSGLRAGRDTPCWGYSVGMQCNARTAVEHFAVAVGR